MDISYMRVYIRFGHARREASMGSLLSFQNNERWHCRWWFEVISDIDALEQQGLWGAKVRAYVRSGFDLKFTTAYGLCKETRATSLTQSNNWQFFWCYFCAILGQQLNSISPVISGGHTVMRIVFPSDGKNVE